MVGESESQLKNGSNTISYRLFQDSLMIKLKLSTCTGNRDSDIENLTQVVQFNSCTRKVSFMFLFLDIHTVLGIYTEKIITAVNMKFNLNWYSIFFLVTLLEIKTMNGAR